MIVFWYVSDSGHILALALQDVLESYKAGKSVYEKSGKIMSTLPDVAESRKPRKMVHHIILRTNFNAVRSSHTACFWYALLNVCSKHIPANICREKLQHWNKSDFTTERSKVAYTMKPVSWKPQITTLYLQVAPKCKERNLFLQIRHWVATWMAVSHFGGTVSENCLGNSEIMVWVKNWYSGVFVTSYTQIDRRENGTRCSCESEILGIN